MVYVAQRLDDMEIIGVYNNPASAVYACIEDFKDSKKFKYSGTWTIDLSKPVFTITDGHYYDIQCRKVETN